MKDYKSLQNGSDIRGVALEIPGGKPVNLTELAAGDLAEGFALWLSEKTGKPVADLVMAIGKDSRVTGEKVAHACACRWLQMGIKVFGCKMSTTPAMFMATVFPVPGADGAVMATASHLPMERNGLKFFTREGGLDSPDIKAVIALAEKAEPRSEAGQDFFIDALDNEQLIKYNLIKTYSAHLRGIICDGLGAKEDNKPLTGLHIVVDAGNGAGGFYASQVLEPLGADCSGSQFLEPDGTFPNHQPNPENAEAMKAISEATLAAGADLGIIFDTDVDRSSAVDEKGREIARNGIVAIAAVLAAEGHPGTTVVTDSITSTQLGRFLTEDLGVKHLRFKRGYKNVINKGLELNKAGEDCQLAIETSGHAAMKENYFLDDGAYLATRIVVKTAQLKKQGLGISSLLEKLEEPAEAIEKRFAVNDPDFASYAQQVLDYLADSVGNGQVPGMSLELPNYEGVRVNVDKAHGDGWFLIRKSLHDPVMPLNVESNREGGVAEIFAALEPILRKFDKLAL